MPPESRKTHSKRRRLSQPLGSGRWHLALLVGFYLSVFSPVAAHAQSCSYQLSHTAYVFVSGGGSDSVTITAGEGCAWTAASNSSWIKLTSPAAGTGNGAVSYSVAFNGGPEREGSLTIAGQTFLVTQLSCYFSISSARADYAASGGSGSVSVFSETGCTWTASTSAPWIQITKGADGTGGTVDYSVLPNAGPPRTGTITIANLTHQVSQASAAALNAQVTNTNDSGPGSLRQALLDSNANVGHANSIGFNIVGNATIQPLTPLPAITNRISINGINNNGSRVVVSGAASSGYFYLYLRAADSAIRGLVVNQAGWGIYVEGDRAVIENCLIGTDAAGAAARPNSASGVGVCASDVRIGGSAAGAGNVIGANGYAGVAVLCGTGNLIQNNSIGTNAAGADLGNTFMGVALETSGNIVGGPTAGTGNVIAFNRRQGVVSTGESGNVIRRNSIHSNGGIGIDLDDDGVTPNDPLDSDNGANGRQNFPFLASAYQGSTIIQGTFNSTPSTQFVLEFFSSPTCDASGNGEGRIFLGNAQLATDLNGNAAVNVSFPTTTAQGHAITATATGPHGTSEFSGCRSVGLPPPIVSSFSPVRGLPGATIRISGQNFSGATGVLINGAAAAFSVHSASLISAVVPTNASSGAITVLSPNGSGTSGSTFTLLADSDTDGLPDEYEQEHFGHPTAAAAAADADGDGVSNVDEYRAGTLPKDARSAFRVVAVTRSSAGITTLTFTTVAGKFYHLEYRENDAPGGPWQRLQANISGDGAPMTATDSTANSKTRRWYRVVAIP